MIPGVSLSGDLVRQAAAAHAAGRWDEADALYRQATLFAPFDAEAHSLLGRLEIDRGRPAEALAHIRRAVDLRPGEAAYHLSLATCLQQLPQPEAALAAFETAARLEPRHALTHALMGRLLRFMGRMDAAEAACRRALELDPELVATWSDLGNILRRRQRFAESEAAFQQVLKRDPGFANIAFNMGTLMRESGRPAEAAQWFTRALAEMPGDAEALLHLCEAEQALGQAGDVVEALRRRVEVNAGDRTARRLLAKLLVETSRFAEAVPLLEGLLADEPDATGLLVDLGTAHMNDGAAERGREIFERSASVSADPGLRFNVALATLVQGRLAEGWPDYEHRFASQADPRRALPGPVWDGTPLAGRRLLLHCEQGAGDNIQFARYATLLAREAPVVLRARTDLLRLFASLEGVTVVGEADPAPGFDVQTALGSLPGLCRTELASIPAAVPYLRAPAAAVAGWRTRLAPIPGLRVGLAWAGNPTYPQDTRRSIAPARLAGVLAVPGVAFVSLQRPAMPGPHQQALLDWMAELGDFAATAALIEALDLVVSVDTAVAHLAGALGRPVWLLNRFDTDWRWLREGDDSPWYPTMRILRQPRPGDWESVLARVAVELGRLVEDYGA